MSWDSSVEPICCCRLLILLRNRLLPCFNTVDSCCCSCLKCSSPCRYYIKLRLPNCAQERQYVFCLKHFAVFAHKLYCIHWLSCGMHPEVESASTLTCKSLPACIALSWLVQKRLGSRASYVVPQSMCGSDAWQHEQRAQLAGCPARSTALFLYPFQQQSCLQHHGRVVHFAVLLLFTPVHLLPG